MGKIKFTAILLVVFLFLQQTVSSLAQTGGNATIREQIAALPARTHVEVKVLEKGKLEKITGDLGKVWDEGFDLQIVAGQGNELTRKIAFSDVQSVGKKRHSYKGLVVFGAIIGGIAAMAAIALATSH